MPPFDWIQRVLNDERKPKMVPLPVISTFNPNKPFSKLTPKMKVKLIQHQVRFPMSKKRRIRNKWAKDPRNFRAGFPKIDTYWYTAPLEMQERHPELPRSRQYSMLPVLTEDGMDALFKVPTNGDLHRQVAEFLVRDPSKPFMVEGRGRVTSCTM